MERRDSGWGRRVSSAASAALLVAACRHAPVGVDASALQVRADVTPTAIAASARPDAGQVQVVVSVTNPGRQAVTVQLGGPPYKSGNIPAAETEGIGFGVRVLPADSATRGAPSEWTWGQPTVTLGARATLRHTFVVSVGAEPAGGLHVTPGTYRVVASFGRREAAPVTLHVRP
jgi:hypothetical protein